LAWVAAAERAEAYRRELYPEQYGDGWHPPHNILGIQLSGTMWRVDVRGNRSQAERSIKKISFRDDAGKEAAWKKAVKAVNEIRVGIYNPPPQGFHGPSKDTAPPGP
jgi:hypothetical protein